MMEELSSKSPATVAVCFQQKPPTKDTSSRFVDGETPQVLARGLVVPLGHFRCVVDDYEYHPFFSCFCFSPFPFSGLSIIILDKSSASL